MSKKNTLQANEQLREERMRRGWSQQKVADQLGITVVTVNRWERGKQQPTPYYRQQLSALFEKPSEGLGFLSPVSRSSEAFDVHSQEDSQSDLRTHGMKCDRDDLSSPLEIEQTSEEISLFLKPSLFLWQFFHSSLKVRVMLSIALLGFIAIISLLVFANSLSFYSRIRSKKSTNGSHGASIPSMYGVNGHLILDDALMSEQTHGSWHISNSPPSTGCHILNGRYTMWGMQSNYCLVDNPLQLTNFVYQIEMITIQGQSGGVVFRVNDSQDFYYNFQIRVDGSYCIYRSNPQPATENVILKEAKSPAITPGYNHSNLLF